MKKLISTIMACILVSGTAFSAHAIDFRSYPQEVTPVSYDSSQIAEYAEHLAAIYSGVR